MAYPRLVDGNGIVSCRSCLEPFPTTMPNYFYLDANGQKQGPVNDQQLQALATQGIIMPDTPLVTDGGHRGKAGQIQGLFTAPSPNPFTAPMPNQSVPQNVSVTVAKDKTCTNPSTPIRTTVGIGLGVLPLFLVFLTGKLSPALLVLILIAIPTAVLILNYCGYRKIVTSLFGLLFIFVLIGIGGIRSCVNENERLIQQHSDFMRDREERNQQNSNIRESGEEMKRRVTDKIDQHNEDYRRRQEEEQRRIRGY